MKELTILPWLAPNRLLLLPLGVAPKAPVEAPNAGVVVAPKLKAGLVAAVVVAAVCPNILAVEAGGALVEPKLNPVLGVDVLALAPKAGVLEDPNIPDEYNSGVRKKLPGYLKQRGSYILMT